MWKVCFFCVFINQVWEMVPFLVSYQSPVLKEEALVPAYPEQLNLTWNGW